MGGPGHGGPMAAMMTGGKPKSFRKTTRTFLGYLKPYRYRLIVVLAFAIASTGFAIIGPRLIGNATTRLFEGVVAVVSRVPGASIDFAYIGRIALIQSTFNNKQQNKLLSFCMYIILIFLIGTGGRIKKELVEKL